jgi:hypothetical protein
MVEDFDPLTAELFGADPFDVDKGGVVYGKIEFLYQLKKR